MAGAATGKIEGPLTPVCEKEGLIPKALLRRTPED